MRTLERIDEIVQACHDHPFEGSFVMTMCDAWSKADIGNRNLLHTVMDILFSKYDTEKKCIQWGYLDG